jgi:hypothetical protein
VSGVDVVDGGAFGDAEDTDQVDRIGAVPGLAAGLTHIDPKVGIPASGPWSRDQANHPASVTAGFIGTAECIDKARTWAVPRRRGRRRR